MTDITRFCAINSYRGWMNKPFRREGFLYATNGHIAVRMPNDALVDVGEGDESGKVIALFEKCEQAEYTWVAVPRVKASKNCTHCDGAGKTSECPDCDGKGEFEHGMYDYQCQRCDGAGAVPPIIGARAYTCEACSGSGIHWHDGADVAHAHYAKKYLHLIAEQFPGAEIGVPKDEMAAAMWRCGDVLGLLMPMMRESWA